MAQPVSGPLLSFVVVVGNPRAGSRTLSFATAIAGEICTRLGGEADSPHVIDLALIADKVFDFSDETVNGLVDRVIDADVAVVASPVYKAAYTGLLKAFLDRFQAGSLDGVVAVPVMVGAGLQHSLSGEMLLRPLLGELGATVPCPVLYAIDSDLDLLSGPNAAWLDRSSAAVRRQIA